MSGTHAGTGNYSKSYTDISFESGGFDVEVSRTYNSRNDESGLIDNDESGLIGKGWTFGFESTIKNYSEELYNTKVVILPDGSNMNFEYENGVYKALNSRAKLEATSYGFMLTTKDQYTYGFNWKVTSGKLIWMCDRNGNKVNVNYDSNGKIQNITDSFGRSITIEYNSNGLISKVQDPLNRLSNINIWMENYQR